MVDPEKNRFAMEDMDDEPPETRWVYKDQAERENTVFLDEYSPASRRWYKNPLNWILIGGALLILSAFSIISFLYYSGYFQIGSKAPMVEGSVDSEMKDRYYVPGPPYGETLQKAVALYRSHERDRAKRAFENFVDEDHPDGEKSIALTYLGIMAMETERYALGRHQLLRALRYDGESVSALVNLSIVERRMGNRELAEEYAKKARELAPSDPTVNVLLGNLLTETKDLDEAVDAYEKGIHRSPDDPLLYYNLALSLVRQEKYDEAIRNFALTIKNQKTGELAVRSHAHMGRIYFAQGNLELAVDHLKEAASMAPDNGRYRYNLGVAYLRTGQKKAALDEFKAAIESGATDKEVYYGLAQAFQEMNQPSMAKRALNKAIYANPGDLTALFMLGDLYLEGRELIPAAETYKKIINTTPGDASTREALLKLGVVYLDMERYTEASETFERLLSLDPGNVDALFGLGAAYHKAGRPHDAVSVWKRALATNEQSGANKLPLSRNDERRIRMALAKTYGGEGAYDLALKEYRLIRALNKRDPVIDEDPELEMESGRVYLLMKDYSSAIAHYERVASFVSTDAQRRMEAFRALAKAHLEIGGRNDLDQARAYANKAARMAPDRLDIQLIRATILMKTGSAVDREKAIEILRAVTASDVEANLAARAYNLLGTAYYDNGEYSRSLRAYDHSIQLDPSLTDAYENQRRASSAYENSLRQ